MSTCTITEYISKCRSYESKIEAIDALIDQMLVNAVEVVDNSSTISYSLDDGQMKVTTEYRSIEDVAEGIKKLEKLRSLYLGRCSGNITVLRGRLNY